MKSGQFRTFGAKKAAEVAYNLRFPGQYYMTETGLNQNYFRENDPQVSRYVESDRIGMSAAVGLKKL